MIVGLPVRNALDITTRWHTSVPVEFQDGCWSKASDAGAGQESFFDVETLPKIVRLTKLLFFFGSACQPKLAMNV
jgi:hypothetical protein